MHNLSTNFKRSRATTLASHTTSIETINTTLAKLPTLSGTNAMTGVGLTGIPTLTGINSFTNTGNTYYGSGANFTGILVTRQL